MGDSLAMATDVEKYSHSCVNGCSVCLWTFCNAFPGKWKMWDALRRKTHKSIKTNKYVDKQTN